MTTPKRKPVPPGRAKKLKRIKKPKGKTIPPGVNRAESRERARYRAKTRAKATKAKTARRGTAREYNY